MNGLSKNLRLSSFVLRLIAIFTMLIDHIGYFMDAFYGDMPSLTWWIFAFRLIGRLAMPLYCFLLVEGTIHTKNVGRYILRLGIIGIVVLAGQLICEYAVGYAIYEGNIFIDLILGVLMVWLLRQKEPWKKLLAILPMAVGIISYVCFAMEYNDPTLTIWWYPYFLRTQYGFFSLLICLAFYLGYIVTSRMTKVPLEQLEFAEVDDKEYVSYNRAFVNLMEILFFAIAVLILWAIGLIWPSYDYLNASFETYSLLVCLLILFYSGKEGYHSRWFHTLSYLNYPITLFLLYTIFSLIYYL